MAKIKHVYTIPSNNDQVQKVRKAGRIEIKSCPTLKKSTKLRDYQTVGAINLALTRFMVLGDDPGLGKTLQSLTAYGIAKNANPNLKLLVVTTKSAKGQWGGEIDRFMSGISYHVLDNKYKPKGAKRQLMGKAARMAQYSQVTADVFITGYYTLRNEPHFLAQVLGEDYVVIFDEVQALKNHKSKAHIGAELLVPGAHRVYGLTATPIKNRLLEFYYIFKIVVPGLFQGVTRWKDEFTIQKLKMIPMKGGNPRYMKEIVDYKNLDKFKEIIDPYFLRRSAEDVAKDLPGIIAKKISFPMSAAQAKLYSEALAGIVYEGRVRQTYFEMTERVEEAEVAGKELPLKYMERYGKISAKYEEILTGDFLKNNKNAALGFCQLIANGPQWLDKEEKGSSAKEDAFTDLVEGELYGGKIIVYTRYRSGIDRLENIVKRAGLTCTRVTGSENEAQRVEAMRSFQDKENGVDVIFITDAGSAAINLQSSGVLLFFDTPWAWGDLVQIIGRARRIGSTFKNVLVYYLEALETIDSRVLEVLLMKKTLNQKVLGEQAAGALMFDGVEKQVPDNLIDERGEVSILFDEIFK